MGLASGTADLCEKEVKIEEVQLRLLGQVTSKTSVLIPRKLVRGPIHAALRLTAFSLATSVTTSSMIASPLALASP